MVRCKKHRGEAENIILETPQGRLMGTLSVEGEKRTKVFKGIP